MYHSIVLVKQVPDTANITGNVMQEDGTVNRAKLPAVFNPEDRVALEMALRVKDQYGGSVTAVTMGPPRASDMLRECLYMGADQVVLISDRKFAGADTLATSYVLSEAVKKIGSYDFIFAGRQAIDGDTAQVGPQTCEKLNLPQITYLEEVISIEGRTVTARRKIEGGYEVVRCSLPVLLTVIKDAVEPRPFSAKRVMAFKGAKSLMEIEKLAEGNSLLYVDQMVHEFESRSLFIRTLTMDDLKLEPERCGVQGSPTKVYKVESVVLSGGEHEMIEPTKAGLGKLVDKLMEDHILG
ncbi:MAG: electron transfer flavoprotein subunit beta/FixA family protein [Ignavibacteriales bacterium]|nr:electron transfer flavoprotein subunit beta/FixA family protein [Ignavibacteriales bacterium]